jgi:hypothetical protein
LFNDSHTAAAFLIQHPLRKDELIAAGKNNLHLVQSKRAASAHYRHGLTVQGVMLVVNGQQNMRSV